MVNLPRIKGSHNAMLSGIAAAEAAFKAIGAGRAHDKLAAYEDTVRTGEIGLDLEARAQHEAVLVAFGTAARRRARRHSICG